MKSIKEEKNVEKIRATYDEIVNELILEREEAVRIAQAYLCRCNYFPFGIGKVNNVDM